MIQELHRRAPEIAPEERAIQCPCGLDGKRGGPGRRFPERTTFSIALSRRVLSRANITF